MCWEHSHLILYCIIIFSLHWTYLLLHIIKSYISYLIHLKCQKPIQRLSSGFNKILYLFIHLGYMYLCVTYIIFIVFNMFNIYTLHRARQRAADLDRERERQRQSVCNFPSTLNLPFQLWEQHATVRTALCSI